MGFVGVSHGVAIPGADLFFATVHLHGGPAPVRRYLPELIDLVLDGNIHPGKVFDLTLPLDRAAEGYRAMDERRAIKTAAHGLTTPCRSAPPRCRSRYAPGDGGKQERRDCPCPTSPRPTVSSSPS